MWLLHLLRRPGFLARLRLRLRLRMKLRARLRLRRRTHFLASLLLRLLRLRTSLRTWLRLGLGLRTEFLTRLLLRLRSHIGSRRLLDLGLRMHLRTCLDLSLLHRCGLPTLILAMRRLSLYNGAAEPIPRSLRWLALLRDLTRL